MTATIVYTWFSDGDVWMKAGTDVQSADPCVLVSRYRNVVYAWTGGVGTSHTCDNIDDAMIIAFGEP